MQQRQAALDNAKAETAISLIARDPDETPAASLASTATPHTTGRFAHAPAAPAGDSSPVTRRGTSEKTG